MQVKSLVGFALCAAILLPNAAMAHFGVVKTDKSVIAEQKDAQLNITFEFTHPFEQTRMDLVKPEEAGYALNGKKFSLLNSLKAEGKKGEGYFTAAHKIKETGVYQFYMNPAPYFEQAEGKFIRHQTKTIVEAFGAGEGWDQPIGLKAEIVPLAKPYGVLSGGLFSGQVLYKGKPAPNVIVEIEYYNEKSRLKAPNDAFVTLEVKTDANGVFHAALPLEGWWGFAALIDDDEQVTREGKKYPVELGAILWLKTESYKK
ncbi:MAG: DUF4198 domain-containing protein [Helicobacteraceae bacterium]|jgi:cobalt/nickel transport protein|nr:DUF4198 domain-containing protein [Helicobacteraceae bacterium]